MDNDRSCWVNIEKGVREGCVGSLDLFSLYTQFVMNKLVKLDGIKVGGLSF